MAEVLKKVDRRTSADDVFDYLKQEIVSLRLLPGTRISEVEIAKQFDVSRQPVREAFIRLSNLELLQIRPQKATVVRKFSNRGIQRARFIRVAVECEVLREACNLADPRTMQKLDKNLADQARAIKDKNVSRFHELDYSFHRLLCAAAGREYVYETISDHKSQVDRLCMLSLSEPATMDELFSDHEAILGSLKNGEEEALIGHIRHHLSRLDETIVGIRRSHADFFED